ncbi:MAG TPA: amino acid adenylation domain-containing protein, partial [Longimicrobiaceae bacterium]
LTPNGKVDRRALPTPEIAAPDGAYRAPRTAVEEVLSGIWAEVLGVERVGVDEVFFELGGHSLLAMRVVSRVREKLGVEVPLRVLFDAPTVAALAGSVQELLSTAALLAPPIERFPREGMDGIPLSFAQQRLWLVDRLEPGSAAYNMPGALRLRGRLHLAALRASLDALVRRHESLRTTFAERDDGPVQVIRPAARVSLPVVDLGRLSAGTREPEVRRLVQAEALRPFDLAEGPLLRNTLLGQDQDDHVLCFTMHHVIGDGWSMDVLVKEFSVIYAALSRGEAPVLPELPVQYADYTVWQRGWLGGEVLEEQIGYWKQRLAGAPPLLELPIDHARTVDGSPRAGCRHVGLSVATTNGLRALSRREGTTLFMTLLAGWQALLGRYAGQDDVVVGSPVAGRTRREVEGLIGFFVNMLALRTELAGDPTWQELLGRVRETALGAYAHQELPFERLVDEMASERSLVHSPVFQVTFGLERATGRNRLPSMDGLALELFEGAEMAAQFDLDLTLVDGDGPFAGNFVYRAALFEPETVERMAGHLEVLLEAVAAEPERRVAEVSLLRSAERAEVLAVSRGAARAFPRDRLVHELIAARAAAWPQAAAAAGSRVLSYGELQAQATRLAARLRARGVGPEVAVAVVLDRSVELAVALLAVLQAGGAFIPADPAYPRERLESLVADSGTQLLLTHSTLACTLPAGATEVLCVDTDEDVAEDLPSPRVEADALAYLCYTSGSTGRPKAAMVSHRSLVCYAEAMRERMELGVGDRVLQFASPAFDVMIEEVFPAWLSGACVVFPQRDLLGSPHELLQLLDREQVSVVELPTAFWHEWVRHVAEEGVHPPESLRLVIVGGERVLPERMVQWAGLGLPLLHVFGLTETTVTSTTLRLEAGDDGSRWSNLPVGVPLANAAVYVLDGEREPVPAGVPGELYLGGETVARGYLGRPYLTAERYVPDPFAVEPGARLYQTGDRVRWLADGTLEFLGRIDQQVKIRGYRIEPAEIEAALAEHPAVREAAVIVREDVPGDRRLVAYVSPAAGYSAGPGEMRRVAASGVELWPSHGEYPVYDDLLYAAMAGDRLRNEGYLDALRAVAEGKTVVDVGTGGEIVLTRLALEAGARKVYAIEAMEESFRRAEAKVRELGLEDRVTLIHGDATTVELPEPVDVCVSELIGCIGGSEGAVAILNHARRWLAPDGVMVPRRCATRVAAVTLPDKLHEAPAFTEAGAHYAEQVFAVVGHRDDVRLCVRRFPKDHLLSESTLFEDLDFAVWTDPAFRNRFELRVEREGRLDGLLLWIQLQPGERTAVDALQDDCAWLPMFFPVFYPGVEVRAGDVLRVESSGAPASGAPYPDYHLRGTLARADGTEEAFAYDSWWKRAPAEPNALHRRLVTAEGVRVRPPERGRVGAEELRAHVGRELPSYMVPSAFVVLEALPLTSNGKLDRHALPAPEWSGVEYVAPRTVVEEVLAGIWGEVLGTPRVGTRESFFELGGHSLLATQVVSRVRKAFGVELPLRVLFEAPTVTGLAERLESLLRSGTSAEQVPLERVPREGPLPLSFAQQRLWLVDRLEPGSAAYNMPFALRLRGALGVAALRASLNALVRRHETLRTLFSERGGEPVQVVHPAAPAVLAVVDLRDRADAEREAERLAVEEALRPFDLAGGPLLRSTLLRLNDDDHVLLLTLHHIVSDGWSMDVLVREVSVLYAALCQGGAVRLPELPVQYADYAVWQRKRLDALGQELQLAFWREQLAGAPSLLEIPTDRPRSAGQSARAGWHELVLPAELAHALRAVSRLEGTSLFMTVLAGWQALLARYAGQEDLVVGSPVAGRIRVELEGLIGFFVNMLPLRADLSDDPTPAELLRRVRERVLGAYAHQELPFERLVEELTTERNLAYAPVFQVVFSLERPAGRGALPDLGEAHSEPFGAGARLTKFDLYLSLADDDEALRGTLIYRAALFDAETVERLAGHLEAVLRAMAADPERRLAEVSLLSEAERAQLLNAWISTDAEVPEGCVHERFALQAARTPEAHAVLSCAEAITYAELERRANRLAHHLRTLGVGTDACVGILLERGADTVVAVLGVLKAGAAYAALDPSYPDARIRFMLGDVGARAVVSHASLEGRLDGFHGPVVRLDTDAEAISRQPDTAPWSGAGPRSLAYVIYTSGSTGTPKGVLLEHRGLAGYLAWFDREVLGAEGFAVPLVSSLSFDAHVRQLFPPLLRGEAVWVLPEETVRDPAVLLEALCSRERVSFGGVPSLWSAVLDRVRSGDGPRPAGLSAVLLGGEALPVELAERTFATFPGVALWNHYGPTEATVNATAARVRPGEPVRIGRPVANARVYLLDGSGHPVPVGVPGELHVGGTGVSRGYLGRAELTAERFLPDPFSAEPGARMYRSGDRARWASTGEMEYVGRVDGQLKVRGFRIEPGEVEAALERHPRVREAVVASHGESLVAYVVAEEGAPAPTPELRAHLRERLPEYMVPAAFVMLDRFPLNANGKTDRGALQASGAVQIRVKEAPRTTTEELLCAIWAEVLGTDEVGTGDDFFSLGGHSLLATQVASRVRRVFGVEVPLRALFEAPTVVGLAERIEALRHDRVPGGAPPLERASREQPLPLSFAQQRLWVVDRLDPGSSAYNLPYVLRLRGALDLSVLQRSFDALVRRHETLRTLFAERDGVPVQVVRDPAPVKIDSVDLRGLRAGGREDAARRLAAVEALRPFDLSRGPLLRSSLLRLDEQEYVLCFTLHHIVSDGWSTGVLVREVSAFYTAFSRGEEPGLPELPVQYVDYAAWQRDWLSGTTLEVQLAYWKTRLAGAPPLLEIPTDRPRGAGRDARAERHAFPLGAELTRRLRELSRREGATLFMTALAGWQALLGRYAGEDDVVVGTPVAGRSRVEVEGLIGFFVNLLPLRVDLHGDPTWGTLLGRVREEALGAYAHQDLPFERLVDEVVDERTLTHAPLVQVAFSLARAVELERLSLGNVELESVEVGEGAAKFDLYLDLSEEGEGLRGALVYRTALFEPVTVARMAGHLEILLEAMCADPRGRLRDAPLLREEECRAMLAAGDAVPGVLPAPRPLHLLFREQAARTPEAVALTCQGDSLTYAELDRRSARVAAALRRRGAGPETRVALCAERSIELVVGTLGILAAGAVYVPVDPAYPADRVAYLLEDSGCPVVLAQERQRTLLSGCAAEVLFLEESLAGTAASEPPFPVEVDPESAAYVIYTSGSTGRPKGVVVTHANVARLFSATAQWFGFGADDVWTFFHSYAFDFSVWEVWGALLHGGRLVVVPYATSRSSEEFYELLVREGVTVLNQTPSAFRQLAAVEETRGASPALALRFVVFGGEGLDPRTLRGWMERHGNEAPRLVNMYGITETTVHVTYR